MSGQHGDIYNLLALAAYLPERERQSSSQDDGHPRLPMRRAVQQSISERVGVALRRRRHAGSA